MTEGLNFDQSGAQITPTTTTSSTRSAPSLKPATTAPGGQLPLQRTRQRISKTVAGPITDYVYGLNRELLSETISGQSIDYIYQIKGSEHLK